MNSSLSVNIPLIRLFRKGSVIAVVEMTFKDTVGESEIAALMKEATKDGKLGQIEVSQVVAGRAVNGKY